MSDIKKARSDAATPEQAREINSETAKDIPNINNNTSKHVKQQSPLKDILLEGKENSLTAQQLADILGVSDTRVITRDIARLRQMRVPICAACSSKHSGYYIAASPGELEAYLRSLSNRMSEIYKMYYGLKDHLDNWTGQTRIEGFENEQTRHNDLLCVEGVTQ